MPKRSSEPFPVSPCKRITVHGPTMGTRWSARVDADASLNLTALRQHPAAAVQLVDQQMWPWKPDSDLLRPNRALLGTWVDLPAELLAVLACALDIHRLSAGAFDPGVGAQVAAWGFGAVREAPDAAAIQAARQATPCSTRQVLALAPGAGGARKLAALQLDVCGIAIGYAVDCMAAVLQPHAVQLALLALDGELLAVGSQAGGAPWAVALEHPEPGRRAVHAHTMDAHRIAPVNLAVASMTVPAGSCMHADAWATALLVAGPGEGLALAQRMRLDVLFLLRSADGNLAEMGLSRFGSSSMPTNSACERTN